MPDAFQQIDTLAGQAIRELFAQWNTLVVADFRVGDL
jgi:hypothetical protein